MCQTHGGPNPNGSTEQGHRELAVGRTHASSRTRTTASAERSRTRRLGRSRKRNSSSMHTTRWIRCSPTLVHAPRPRSALPSEAASHLFSPALRAERHTRLSSSCGAPRRCWDRARRSPASPPRIPPPPRAAPASSPSPARGARAAQGAACAAQYSCSSRWWLGR